MLTYTTGQTLFTGTLTSNATTANVTFAQTFINQFSLELLHKYPFIQAEQTFKFNGFQTLPAIQFYTLPVPMRKVSTVVVTVGSTVAIPAGGFNWPVKECPSLQFWNQLNLTNNIKSDIPQYFMYINGQLGLYPTPANGYNPITIIGQAEPVALNTADITNATITTPYTLTLSTTPAVGDVSETLNAAFSATFATGTYQMLFSSGEQRLVTLTSGATTCTFTQALTKVATTTVTVRTATGGEILTIGTATPSASWIGYVLQTTDQRWYQVDGYIDTTHVSISQPYNGTAIATASSTIGQSSMIQQAYQMLPIYRAADLYYTVVSKDADRRAKYKELGDVIETMIKNVESNKTTDPTVEDVEKPIINPNLSVQVTDSSTNQ